LNYRSQRKDGKVSCARPSAGKCGMGWSCQRQEGTADQASKNGWSQWFKCDAPAFASAGAHFNPLNMKHRLKNADGPHAGDLPDLCVTKDGVGRYEVLVDSATLRAGKLSVFEPDGKAIVIHASSDDNITDPSGNSGDRIACRVITNAPARNKKEPKV
jgi:Cu/Zn superoxide dismutase